MSANPARPGITLALVSVVLVSVAQLALKFGMSAMPAAAGEGWLDGNLVPGLHWWWLVLGLACYAASMAVWIKVLTYLPLSLAYPLLSLSYVLVFLVATALPVFAETASWQRFAGVALVVFGVLLVSWPAARARN